MIPSFLRSLPIAASLLLILTACGGGGGGSTGNTTSNRDSGINNITFTALPNITVNENAPASLTLNASGDGSENLTYDWEVTFQGEDYAFTGQGSKSIRFTAPEVVGDSTVSVRVRLGLKDGKLLGSNSDSAFVSVIDLNPPSSMFAYSEVKETELPSVSEIDLSTELEGSTWLTKTYTTWEHLVEGENVTYEKGITTISYYQPIDGEPGFNACSSSESDTVSGFASDVDCAGDLHINHYQQGSSIRLEAVCDSQVMLAKNFSKLSDTTRDDFGSISLEFKTYNNLDATAITCGESVVTHGSAQTNGGSVEVDVSMLSMLTDYYGNALWVEMVLNGAPRNTFYNVSTMNVSDVALYSLGLPALLGVDEAQSGTIDLSKATFNSFEGDFEVTIKDSYEDLEDIAAVFALTLE